MIVISSKFGQLANRLFLFAHFIAFAIEHNLTIINPAFEEYAQFFEPTCTDLLCRYPINPSGFPIHQQMRRVVYELIRILGFGVNKAKIANPLLAVLRLPENQEYDLSSPEFLDFVTQKKVVFVRGWLFRDNSNFVKHADKIRDYFAPISVHRSRVKSLISTVRQSCQVLIGVHIRQGDYAEFMDGKYFYEVDQYLHIMEKVEALFPSQKVGFLICSNVQQNKEDFASFNATFATHHLVEDLYSLAQCDYIVGTVSTYTLWASFYGEVPLYTIQDPDRSPTITDFLAYGSEP
ncbi:MAG: alpha-1,2-fucosyltransferase [Timaviella obliquedivisa GSE-PSE-MK23-08B]|jgi:hypothetical protein|nr:alpha-1,2-fucosyltransferase [Timaviella obliquedivisa GSE-PSE-MK23-08B]